MEYTTFRKMRAVSFLAIGVSVFVVPNYVSANYFEIPATSSPPISSFFDHDVPNLTTDNNFVKYTGEAWTDGSASEGSCTYGQNCYDGHNGVDFDGDYGDQF
jgi:hypothetical protein